MAQENVDVVVSAASKNGTLPGDETGALESFAAGRGRSTTTSLTRHAAGGRLPRP